MTGLLARALTFLDNRYIMEAAKSLRDDFGGDVPKTAKELQSLKGVGPKMAYLCLQAAWGMYVLSLYTSRLSSSPSSCRNDGIGVDMLGGNLVDAAGAVRGVG